MTTQEKMEVVKAFLEGKTIQCKAVKYGIIIWLDDNNPCWDWNNFEYRVKSEKKEPSYRPYKNIDEFRQHYANIKDQVNDEVFDGFWLKRKDPGKTGRRVFLVAEIIDEGRKAIRFATIDDSFSLNAVFELFTYLDGTPFGMPVE